MSCRHYPISSYSVGLARNHFKSMAKLVRLLHKISGLTAYHALLGDDLPETARHNPRHYSAMMGYDFHLSGTGPKLIEVNTNAGGFWFAGLAENSSRPDFSGRVAGRLLSSFLTEFRLFTAGKSGLPEFLAIVDEDPVNQFLYPEMRAFSALFKKAGIDNAIVDPMELQLKGSILYWGGKRVDMIYNRHCDFYLHNPATARIRTAWLAGTVCLTPNPHTYGLLADKRRMALWSDSNKLEKLDLGQPAIDFLLRMVPSTHLLAAMAPEQAWRTRKQWVFKPDTGYASRGVYVGNKLTAAKFAQLDPDNTLVQAWIPPSLTRFSDELPFKTDYRLFAYQNRILCVSARLYHGQVTNLRTPNGGFAKVIIS